MRKWVRQINEGRTNQQRFGKKSRWENLPGSIIYNFFTF